jgi:hypothetical protein
MECPDCQEEMDQLFYYNKVSKVYVVELHCDPCEIYYSGMLKREKIDGEKAKQVFRGGDIPVPSN